MTSAPQTWLLTGGAGYIGSHVADAFLASGKDVVIYDSLYQGLESRIEYLRKKYNKEIPLIVADIRDTSKFNEILTTYKPYGVVHTEARSGRINGEARGILRGELPRNNKDARAHFTARHQELHLLFNRSRLRRTRSFKSN